MFASLFSSPRWLLLLVPLVALFVLYWVFSTRRPHYSIKLSSPLLLESLVKPRTWKFHTPPMLMFVALLLLVLALADPHMTRDVSKDKATIIFALDASLSMSATDVSPSRFEAAKSAVKSFVDAAPDNLDIGIVAFDRSANVLSPPTSDHATLLKSLDNYKLGQGTSIGAAIDKSLDLVASANPESTRIIVLSDGKSNDPAPDVTAAARALLMGVPVYTVAFGTPDGLIVDPNNPRSHVAVPVDPEALASIAADAQGKSFSSSTEESLRQAFSKVPTTVASSTQSASLSPIFEAAAFTFLLLAMFLWFVWFFRTP